MKRLWLILSLCVFAGSLTAKPSAPIQASLVLEKVTEVDGKREYTLKFSCVSLSNSEKATFMLHMPDDFVLHEGFHYWSGELNKGESFERTLVVSADASADEVLSVSSVLTLSESNRFAKDVAYRLSPQASEGKTGIESLKYGTKEKPVGKSRRRFSLPEGAIIRR